MRSEPRFVADEHLLLGRATAELADVALSASISATLIALVLRYGSAEGGQGRAAVRDAALTVLPAVGVASLDDAGRPRSFSGNRIGRIRVVDPAGGPIGPGRAIVRNAMKYLPWQLAHLGVRQQVTRTGGRRGDLLGQGALIASMALAGANAWLMARSGRALHDRVAGTTVQPSDAVATAQVDAQLSGGTGRS